ncbi:hypothetical protein [Rhizobium sp. BR 315]|uniref:hypothetical protein n=1 Tax=Rhizobium sp. BR 315 TaxID=3040014 RepID=UPI003D32E0BD
MPDKEYAEAHHEIAGQEVGRHALKLLCDAIEHRDSPQDMKVVLGARFILRDTAGPAPAEHKTDGSGA